MNITFDSNAWQRVVRPHQFSKDSRHGAFVHIHRALQSGQISGFICETVATLEAIPRAQRPLYLGSRQSPVKITWDESPGLGGLSGSITIGGDSDDHPGLAGILEDSLADAFKLGLRILPVPRIGLPRPKFLEDESVRIALTPEQRANIWQWLDGNANIIRIIEDRGVGKAVLDSVAKRIQTRLGATNVPWFTGLDEPANAIERKEIENGFAEWADGDSVAAHIAYKRDVFCTEDQGKSAKVSILDANNRAWLTSTYGVRFVTLAELAASFAP